MIKFQVFRPATLSKPDSNTAAFLYEYCENFKNSYFEEHLRTAASEILNNNARNSYPEVLC